MKSRVRTAVAAVFPPLFVFALNAWICWRLFHTEYLDQMQSIESAFISLAAYIQHHWPGYDWFPLWYDGMPFTRSYQLGLPYTVALTAQLFGLSPASAYHLIVALAYSVGGVTFCYLARVLGGGRRMAFAAALVFSLFSPSTLLLPGVRGDVGGFLNARRLQALVVYGEGPNVTGLMLAILALTLVHRALRKRTPASLLLASLAMAAVPVVSWPSTVTLILALAAWLAAGEWREVRGNLPRLVLAGAITVAFTLPFALPSVIRSTFFLANVMFDVPTPGPARWISLGLLLLFLTAIRAVLIRARVPFGLRFASLWFVLTGWIVLSVAWAGIRLVPQAERFHLAMEIPMALLVAFAGQELFRRRPGLRRPAILLLAVLCFLLAIHYRQYARRIIRPIEIGKTVEYQEAQWLDGNINGGRVLLPGSTAFWANAFNETPQMTGCCLQSLTSTQPLIVNYLLQTGYGNDEESADYSLLWLKAYAVQAIALGGPNSREHYKDFKHPYRFQGRLPLVWSSGDDFIYQVSERTPGLARVVRGTDLVQHPPVNGIDVAELRPFVRALDDASLPVASFLWMDPNRARVTGNLSPGQAVSIAVTWDPGWSATANGRVIPVRADGLALIAIEPNCSGACEVRLHWSPGLEPAIAVAVALLTLIAMTIWCFAARPGSPYGL